MKKKRVLMVINSDLIFAGVPNVVMEIIRNSYALYDFDIITYHYEEGKYDDEFRSYGGNIYKLSLINYQKHKIFYFMRSFQIIHFMKKILNSHKYDVIHCHNGIESGIFSYIAKKYGIPIRIVHAHGIYDRKGKNIFLMKYFNVCKSLICKYSSKRIACSSLAGNSLFLDAKFDNILNPINSNYYRNIKKEDHNSINILQIGYFCENKNQKFSLYLLKELMNDYENINLFLLGYKQDELYYEELLDIIKKENLNKNVQFLKSDYNKQSLFKTTDVILIPSNSEGLPLVALESQVAEIPCLLSDHVSKDANIGLAFFAEYNNVSDWKEKIKTLIKDKSIERAVNIDKVDSVQWCRKIRNYYEEQ